MIYKCNGHWEKNSINFRRKEERVVKLPGVKMQIRKTTVTQNNSFVPWKMWEFTYSLVYLFP